MFTNESTENLLANLENELTEVIELDNPQVIEIEKDKMFSPPIPAKRQPSESNLAQNVPVPAARRLQSLDKKEKNDENEIIQLSSISSSSASENLRNFSQTTVVHSKERKSKSANSKVLLVHQAEVEETKFYVSKRGKWAEDDQKEKLTEIQSDVEIQPGKEKLSSPQAKLVDQKPHLEVISEIKPKKSAKIRKEEVSTESSTQTTFDSSSESSSSTESCVKPKKKHKKVKKDKKKSKKKSEEPTTSVEESVEENQKSEPSHAIGNLSWRCARNFIDWMSFCSGIFLHSTGVLKYSVDLKSLRVKVSLFNEDTGKQIDEPKWTQHGSFNDDFQ